MHIQTQLGSQREGKDQITPFCFFFLRTQQAMVRLSKSKIEEIGEERDQAASKGLQI
jgi:hypothetical protein